MQLSLQKDRNTDYFILEHELEKRDHGGQTIFPFAGKPAAQVEGRGMGPFFVLLGSPELVVLWRGL